MTAVQIQKQITTGTLVQFLCALIFGMCLYIVIPNASVAVVVMALIATVILFLRHLPTWLPYVLGLIIGVVLVVLFPQLRLSSAETAFLIVVFGGTSLF